MPGFTDWLNSPERRSAAATLSHLVMRHRLTARSTPGDVFDVLKDWTSGDAYDESADDLVIGLDQRVWNCVSLSRLFVVTYCMLTDQNPYFPRGIQERRVDTRKLSRPFVRANIRSLFPNVRRTDVPGDSRYTFSGHTWAVFHGTDYDLLMGTAGAAVAMTFPVDVAKNPEQAWVCQLSAPARAVAPLVAVAHAAPRYALAAAAPGVPAAAVRAGAAGPLRPALGPAAAAPVQYWLRGTGARVGPLPGFELVPV